MPAVRHLSAHARPAHRWWQLVALIVALLCTVSVDVASASDDLDGASEGERVIEKNEDGIGRVNIAAATPATPTKRVTLDDEKPCNILFIAGGSKDDVLPLVAIAWYLRQRNCHAMFLAEDEYMIPLNQMRVNFVTLEREKPYLTKHNDDITGAALLNDEDALRNLVSLNLTDSEIDVAKAIRLRFRALRGFSAVVASRLHWSTLVSVAETLGPFVPLFATFVAPIWDNARTEHPLLDAKRLADEAGITYPSEEGRALNRRVWDAMVAKDMEKLEYVHNELFENTQKWQPDWWTKMREGRYPWVQTLVLHNNYLLQDESGEKSHAFGYPSLPYIEGVDEYTPHRKDRTLKRLVAAEDGRKSPIFVGLSLMCDKDEAATKLPDVLEKLLVALRQLDQPAVILVGKSGPSSAIFKSFADKERVKWLQKNILLIGAGHLGWLIKQTSAALIDASSLSVQSAALEGKPLVVFTENKGEAPFWANRVVEFGNGIRVGAIDTLSESELYEAIEFVTSDLKLRKRAELLGKLSSSDRPDVEYGELILRGIQRARADEQWEIEERESDDADQQHVTLEA